MIYLKWVLLMLPSFAMAIVGRLLAPILPFFVQDDGYLPSWLWWFQTPDNPCDGDKGHWKRWPKDTPFWRYCRRVAWFLRNVAYGFDETICGVESRTTDHLEIDGDTRVGDKTGVSGVCKYRLYRDGNLIAFHYYEVRHYQYWHFKACVRISHGWKLWNPKCLKKQYTAYWNPIKGLEWVK